MLEQYRIILGSQSPRRKELLTLLDLPFTCQVIDTEEIYPAELRGAEIPVYLAKLKAAAFEPLPDDKTLLITADTIVWLDGQVLGKPHTPAEARNMLHRLSGKTHQVFTGVCLTSLRKQKTFSVCSDVTFASLTDEEIDYYVEKYNPLDKAGAYGIQEWIGGIGVEKINGSYFNVMGLPVQKLYQELKQF